MQKLQGPGQAGSGQRWQHGAGFWGGLDELSKLLCAAKHLCCAHPGRPMGGCVPFWTGAACGVIASFLNKP